MLCFSPHTHTAPPHLEPHVLAFGAGFAALLHHGARRHDLPRKLLDARGRNPAGAVLGVGGGHRAQQKAGFLDVPYFGGRVDLWAT